MVLLIASQQQDTELEITGDHCRPIEVSVDAAWQTRSSGRSYNSLSGHCSMIGSRTGKIVACAVRNKKCRICDIAARKNMPPKKHDCRQNWSGSAKAMEPDMVVQMCHDSVAKKAPISTLIGDEDSSTIARVRREVDREINKKSDSNHLKKTVTNKLYELQKEHKSILSVKTINYLVKCYTYICQQNQGNPDGVRKGLGALSRHPFGDHSMCHTDWCRYLRQPDTFKFRSLPYGRALSDKKLQEDLRELFDNLISFADKLADLKRTQANESFNRTVASKAPKSQFYSGSESLSFRVGAAVSQKNKGYTYVSEVHKSLGLSPGLHSVNRGVRLDRELKIRHARSLTKKAKRRRLTLKAAKRSSQTVQELREGDTYKTNICLTDSLDVQEIPPPIPVPKQEPLPAFSNTTDLVYFDLETTGLDRTSHITQLAAIHQSDELSTYVMPKTHISTEAAKVTGITLHAGKMRHNGTVVESLSISKALDTFKSFLEQKKPVILTGHNIKSFDCKVLYNAAVACGKEELLSQTITGFIDTLPFFKAQYPGHNSYRQEALVEKITGKKYAAHDALADVKALSTLVDSVSVSELNKFSFTWQYVADSMKRDQAKALYLPSLSVMVAKKVISRSMAEKIASSGLAMNHLILAYKRGKCDGISSLFLEKVDSKVRVTSSKKIIASVCAYLSTL